MPDTEQFPELHAEVWERDEFCPECGQPDNCGDCTHECMECGESEGEHDRCCSIGYDLWCAAVDLQIGE